jgi:AraC-like DNA-binding protein
MADEAIRCGSPPHDLEVRLDRCYDAPVPAAGTARNHTDPCWCAWLIRRGGVEIDHDGGRISATAGQLMLVPGGLRRDQRFQPGSAILSLRLIVRRGDGLPPFQAAAPAAIPPPTGYEATVGALAADAPGNGLARAARAAAAMAAWWEACLAAAWREPAAGAQDPRLAAALAELSQHRGIAPAPWPALCTASGLSRRQLDRLFRTRLGVSPGEWLDRRCAERATALLADPALAVKTVATRCGFADASHFVRWFRRTAGVTPGAWRGL